MKDEWLTMRNVALAFAAFFAAVLGIMMLIWLAQSAARAQSGCTVIGNYVECERPAYRRRRYYKRRAYRQRRARAETTLAKPARKEVVPSDIRTPPRSETPPVTTAPPPAAVKTIIVKVPQKPAPEAIPTARALDQYAPPPRKRTHQPRPARPQHKPGIPWVLVAGAAGFAIGFAIIPALVRRIIGGRRHERVPEELIPPTAHILPGGGQPVHEERPGAAGGPDGRPQHVGAGQAQGGPRRGHDGGHADAVPSFLLDPASDRFAPYPDRASWK